MSRRPREAQRSEQFWTGQSRCSVTSDDRSNRRRTLDPPVDQPTKAHIPLGREGARQFHSSSKFLVWVRCLTLSLYPCHFDRSCPLFGGLRNPAPVATLPRDAVTHLQEFQHEQDRSRLHGASPRPGGRQAYLWRCGRLVERLQRFPAASEIHRVDSRSP